MSKTSMKDFTMTDDELRRLTEALKKEEFRKLLLDYAEEISDPKNREIYEREISALEAERGMNVTFVHPEPGYCVKTSQEAKEGMIRKCFINICKNDQVEKPTCKREANGATWSLPHTCSPPRDDLDNNGGNNKTTSSKCTVYDVVFHPDALRMAETNERFGRMLVDSAIESIERNFDVRLDKVNAKRMRNVQFKGKPTACVLRKPSGNNNDNNNEQDDSAKTSNGKKPQDENNSNSGEDPVASIIDQLKQQYMNTVNKPTQTKPIPTKAPQNSSSMSTSTRISSGDEAFTTPSYKLIHRGHVDMQDYAATVVGGTSVEVASTRPKELVVCVELPLCKTSENVVVDIFEKRLHLCSRAPNYLLDLTLPYPVSESGARAKFDKSRRCLSVTLPVVPFVAKVDIVNVDHISDDDAGDEDNIAAVTSTTTTDDACLSPSPSSSSASSLTESSNLDTVAPTHILTPPETPQQSTIKYTLPKDITFVEYKSSVVVDMCVPSYNADSLTVRFESAHQLHVECESTNVQSGYVQYFKAHVKLLECPLSDSLVGSTKTKSTLDHDDAFSVCFLDEDRIRFVIAKATTDKQDTAKRRSALVSLKSVVDLNNNSSSNDHHQDEFTRFDISQEFVHVEFSRSHLNTNFSTPKVLDDEDDDDDEMKSSGEIHSKLAEKVAAKEASKVTDKMKETLDDDESFLNDDDDDDDDDDDEDSNAKSNENMTSSLSSSMNETSTLSSSLNTYTFLKIKGILKKPRSVSESESSSAASSPETVTAADGGGSANNRYSFSDGGSVMLDRLNSTDSSGSPSSNGGSKKCVSFNKQVVRNIFKPGSTISGMKKPGSSKNKNKKKQQRKRTISDPCSPTDDSPSNKSEQSQRSRSVSESSTDEMGTFGMSPPTNAAAKPPANNNNNSSKKNSKKKKNQQKQQSAAANNVNKENQQQQQQKNSKCTIQFKNKLVAALDD